jgi:hypothetical protein
MAKSLWKPSSLPQMSWRTSLSDWQPMAFIAMTTGICGARRVGQGQRRGQQEGATAAATHVLVERVVPEVDLAVLSDDVRLRLALVRRAEERQRDQRQWLSDCPAARRASTHEVTEAMTRPFLGSVSTMIRFFDICSWTRMTCGRNAVRGGSVVSGTGCGGPRAERQARTYLLRALDDKVSTRVERALCHVGQLGVCLVLEDALVASQHDRQTTDRLTAALDHLLATNVLDIDVDLGRVRRVAQPALVRRNLAVDRLGVGPFGLTDADVGVLEVELGVDVGRHLRIGLEDLLELDVDELAEAGRRDHGRSAAGSRDARDQQASRMKVAHCKRGWGRSARVARQRERSDRSRAWAARTVVKRLEVLLDEALDLEESR